MSKMGLHQLVNYLFIVHVSQAVVDCFAFDFRDRNSRRSQFPRSRDYQHSFSNTYSNTSQQPFYWKRKNETSQNNHKESNYLWRNAKTVTNIKTSTAHTKRRYYIALVSRHKYLSSTPSNIEFDYLDEDQYPNKNTSLKRLHRVDSNNRGVDEFTTRLPSTLRSSSISLGINDPYNVQELLPISKPPNILQESSLFSHRQAFNKFKIKKVDKVKNNIGVSDFVNNEAYLSGKLLTVKVSLKDSQVPTTTVRSPVRSTTSASTTVFTTPNDRVKFFEIYDTNTLRPKRIKLNNSSKYQSLRIPEIISTTENFTNKIRKEESNIPSQFWRLDNPKNARFERKYKNFRKRSFTADGNLDILYQIPDNNVSELHATSKTYSQEKTIVFSKSKPLRVTRTSVAKWSSYPFASVYIYEPTQTHCDASGISPHWLLAAGSCLSRQNLVYSMDERSAYVTYCGEHWRSPERIAYVKRIVVHPKFNPKDKVRRLLFNIGLIQVSKSMSTSCPHWAPIAMMSHQFSTSSAGTMASAVGWGLDRYGSKYTTEKLPHWPLTVYEALVFHNTCPGSSTFSIEKHQADSGASNVYCLLLPEYTGEENDSVHGGLLLVDGKLIALYLQEERRSRGSQSAQYTGVWRLLPWITDIAHEPDYEDITLDV